MKSNRPIEKLLREIEVTPDAKTDRKHWADISAAYPLTDRQPRLWERIMLKRQIKMALAPCTVTAILVGVILLIDPFTSTEAFADIVKAMKKQAWVHAVSRITIENDVQSREHWINFQDAVEIDKKHEGDIRYSNESDDTLYQYNVQRNSLTITSMSDEYAAPRREALPRSPLELLEQITQNYSENEASDISRESVDENGRSIEVIHISTRNEGDALVQMDYTLRVDNSTKLLESIKAVAVEDGVQIARVDIQIGYPQTGPEDIYAAGASVTAEIIDRRPKNGPDEIIAIQSKVIKDAKIPSQDKLILYGSMNMDLVWIPAGDFLMGSPAEEVGFPDRVLALFSRSQNARARKIRHPENEDPQHQVRIEQGFYMSQYEVTCKQFRVYKRSYRRYPHSLGELGKKQASFQMDADNQPVSVSLEEARAFCEWLSEKTGLSVQLPCEAQWEYACRAGTQTRFYWGDSEEQAGQYANLTDQSYEKLAASDALPTDDGNPCLAPVGQYLPNAFGLYDMIGNSVELVDGVYRDDAHSIDPNQNRFNQDEAFLKGGSWQGSLIHGRCASRWTWVNSAGFRVIVKMP